MRTFVFAMTLLGLIGLSQAALTLTEDDTDYTLTSTGAWEMKIQKANGTIWSFKDLTDNTVQNDTVASAAGFTSGDHYSYLGRNAYNNRRSLLWFAGRSTSDSIMINDGVAAPNRFSFTMAPDNSSFQITYTESLTDGYSEYFCNSGYGDVVAGDILMNATITIHDADTSGTIIDWAQTFSGTRATENEITRKYFNNAYFQAYCSIATEANGTYSVDLDGTFSTEDGSNPTADQGMWSKMTIDESAQNTALGLLAGREFVMTRDSGFTDMPVNGRGQYAEDTWAGFSYIEQSMPAAGSGYLPGDFVLETTGALSINIAATPEPTTMGLLALGGLAMLRRRRR